MTQRPVPLLPGTIQAAPLELRSRRGLPRLPRGFVESRAVQRLSAQPMPPMVVLQSPRGFGKTAAGAWLLRQDDDQRHDYVWVNLPHREIGADEFWETVHRRLRDAGLDSADWATLDRSLARRRRKLVLAVDDLHRVTDLSVDDELGELAAHHESLHLLLMTRQVRPVQGMATQLDGVVMRVHELRLGPAETVRMAARLGHQLEHDAAADLAARLGGWPALLRLALADPLLDVDGHVAVDQGAIDQYVQLRLQDISDPQVRRALEMLTVPERLTHELALRLVGEDLLSRVVDQLETDGGQQVVEYDSLARMRPVRAALSKVLADGDPDVYRETNAVTARWFANHAQPAAAVRHAMAAADWTSVADLLQRHWSLLLADHPTLTRQAIDQLPAEVVDANATFLVARDYILNIFAEGRARAAYGAGLLVPDGAGRARASRRLSLRQVLTLHSNGLYDVAHNLVENRDIADAIEESGWSGAVVAKIPGLLLEWSIAYLLGDPGVAATYAFCETAAWAAELGDIALRRDAAAGAALSHVVIGYPVAASAWLDLLDTLPQDPPGSYSFELEVLARSLIRKQQLQGDLVTGACDIPLPPEIGDLEVLQLVLRAEELLVSGRAREAVRLLEAYRVRRPERGVASLVEHSLVNALVEAYLASSQVERARRLLLNIDPEATRHRATWALVDFQSGEYQRVLAASTAEDLIPRQTLQLALLRACAALRLQQRPAAIDAFQSAVSTATQTGMLRPFALIPARDLAELADGDGQVAELLSDAANLRPLLGEPQDGSGLSPRELQVLEVVATGASFAAVASRLFVSPNTVKSQMRDIYRKLAVRGREPAVERARELGLLGR